jgi:hypothetical protein
LFASSWAIIKNSVTEIIRQPVYVILLAAGLALIGFSPAITMFSMTEDEKLMVDMGLATIMLLGVVLAVLSSTQVISREIEARTVGAILSKPVGRLVFIVSKFIGVSIAMAISGFLLTAMLIITLRFGVLSTAMDKIDPVALCGMLAPFLLAVGLAMLCNYLYGWNFSSTAVLLAVILYGLAVGMQFLIPPPEMVHWQPHTPAEILEWLCEERHVLQVSQAALLILMGIWVLSAVAVAASTRVNVVVNTIICISVFFLGMIMQFLLSHASLQSCLVPLPTGKSVNEARLAEVLTGDWPLKEYVRDVGVRRVTRIEKTFVGILPQEKEMILQGTDVDHPPPDVIRVELRETPVERQEVLMKLRRHAEKHPADLASDVMAQIGFAEEQDFQKRDVQVWPHYPWVGRLLPHLYVFWVGDQLMAREPYIPFAYVGAAALYGLGHCVALLALAAYLFEGREVT